MHDGLFKLRVVWVQNGRPKPQRPGTTTLTSSPPPQTAAANELEAALCCAHVPNHLLRMLGAIVQAADLSPILTQSMNMNIVRALLSSPPASHTPAPLRALKSLTGMVWATRAQTEFEDILGKSERILKTPIPLSYTRMTSRFLILWLALLPVALWGQLAWASVPTEAFIAFCFLGIEEIGVQIEEPFSILALEAICESVQGNCIAMIEGELRDDKLVNSRGVKSY